ncbi:STAS domain-containing protein [Bacillus taeanensis]|uniref:RsbR, positive regulator of sigma-B n=1 Tax=Bacillus taeanensis TaxID=273032 RepID=A0A366XNN8_9BACI|nr:STAS domain-containing protein [Bacillus taeanensis]RBW67970.1 RsbR, positive regulator of sigma-B [Bacillus taeanensis]
MTAIGKLPETIEYKWILESIGENVIIADKEYNVVWMNATAKQLFEQVAHLFGVADVQEMIGKNMTDFYRDLHYQPDLMEHLTSTHRATINIKDQYIADIVITPIRNDQEELEGYIVMLMDVTEKARKETEREQLIRELSVPILQVWDRVLALPIIGILDEDRYNTLLERVLDECVKRRARYILIDLSGLRKMDDMSGYQINKMCQALALLGVTCFIVGVSPHLALSLTNFDYTWSTFSSTEEGLKHIISKEN